MRTFACLKAAIVAAVGIVAIGCSQSHSPVTPSALAAPVTGAAAQGVASGSGAFGVGRHLLSPQDKGREDEVEGEGRVSGLTAGTACPTLQFVVESVVVRTTAATTFENGSCGSILPGVKIEAKGTRQLDGSIVASRIEIKDRAEVEVEGEGRVTSLVAGTSCPTLQFIAEGILVRTTGATRFDDGSCSNILPGVKIEAKGTRQLDGSIVASRIEIKDRAGVEVEGEGRVTSLVAGTSCPTLQFIAEGVLVSTTGATRFDDGSCANILPGVKIEAKGTRQADGSIVASRIEIKDRAEAEVEGEGRVTSLVAGTSCPTLQFMVEGVVAGTTAATRFENATCSDIQPGVKVEARAARQPDGSFVASRVKIEEEGIEGEGRVTSLVGGTACPALQFVVEGITVKTSSATIFERGTCAAVLPGTRVRVRGARVTFDTVIASLVRIQD